MKFNQATNNFSAGEWSDKMRARTDVQQYANASELLLNFLPQIQGGIFRRPPTRFLNLAEDQYADLQTAVSNTTVKSKIIPQILSDDSRAVIFAFDGIPSATWFRLNANSPEGGESIITASSGADFSYSAAGIKYTQVGDVIFLAHTSFAQGRPPRVMYVQTFNWLKLYDEFLPSQNWKSVPYMPIQANGSSVTLTASAATGAITITSSGNFFDPGHVGAYFKLSSAGSTGVAKVTAWTSSTQVSATVLSTVPTAAVGSAAGTSWEESAWSNYRGWPRTATAFQGRLIFGGTYTFPDTIWGTRIGNVFDLMERPFEQDSSFTGYTSDNSRPFTLTPNSKESNNIVALSSAKTLMIHTDRSEIIAYGTQGALGPNDVQFESSTSFGASTPMPTRTNNFSVFVEKGGRKLRDVIFSFNEDQYKSSDLTFIADHLTIDNDDPTFRTDQIVEIHGFTQLSSYIFAKTKNGRLLSLTLDRDYQINAWARVQFGGTSELRDHPLVKSMCAIQTSSGVDRVFFIIQRYINGQNVAYVEYMDGPKETSYNPDTYDVEAFYADCVNPNAYEYGSLNRIYSLDHLKGEEVEVWADKEYIGTYTVGTDGEITLPGTYTAVYAGLKYATRGIPMPIEIGQQVPGSSMGFFKRIDEITFKFWNTRGAKYGIKGGRMTDVDFKDPNQVMNQPPALFTGYKKLKVESNYQVEVQPVIEQDKPWPCNVLAIISRGVTYD